MYKIEKTYYGYKIILQGFILQKEMQDWYNDSLSILNNAPETFGLMVDLRKIKTLPVESQAILGKGQRLYYGKGLLRAAIIVQEPITSIQFKRMSQNTGVYRHQQYIDASKEPDWEQQAISWIVEGKEPENQILYRPI